VSAFKDHFSVGSAGYAAYRPTYPRALADFLADASPGTELALDCGCGSGQLSVLLAGRFARVVATDASAKQIENAEPRAGVEYRVAPAEASGLPNGSADLVTAAQAAHWFDLPAFYAEARRVLRPRGIVALVTYGIIEMDEPVHEVVRHFYRDVVGPYWPPERRHVEEGYRAFDFPFAEFPAPPLAIEATWNLGELTGYADTWSATRAAEKALGRAPIERFRRDLAEAWGEPEARRTVRFPLSLRVGRVQPVTRSNRSVI
jgi:SAM-dependent methyltransferase